VLSLDQYRLHFYRDAKVAPFIDAKSEYEAAWKFCNEREAEFKAYVDYQAKCVFETARIGHGGVFIDNTNGSKKARARWIQAARNIGMKVVAVEFWNTLEVLQARQLARPDKAVPSSSVKQQYFAQTCAWLGSEVDEVIVVPT
jgi:predicted kinase